MLLLCSCQTRSADPGKTIDAIVAEQGTTCLNDLRQTQLDASLRRCDQFVEAQPQRPEAFSERSLILHLNGDHAEACRDVAQAMDLINAGATVDPLLKHELDVRQAACKARRSNAGNG